MWGCKTAKKEIPVLVVYESASLLHCFGTSDCQRVSTRGSGMLTAQHIHTYVMLAFSLQSVPSGSPCSYANRESNVAERVESLSTRGFQSGRIQHIVNGSRNLLNRKKERNDEEGKTMTKERQNFCG